MAIDTQNLMAIRSDIDGAWNIEDFNFSGRATVDCYPALIAILLIDALLELREIKTLLEDD